MYEKDGHPILCLSDEEGYNAESGRVALHWLIFQMGKRTRLGRLPISGIGVTILVFIGCCERRL